jgi:Bacteriophage head to tail connecting protein
MMDSTAEACLREQEQLQSQRSTWEAHWREISELVRPSQNFFVQQVRTPGDKRNQKIFDDTAQLALPKFAAAVISMAFPATQQYQKLTCSDAKVAKSAGVQRWFEEVTDIIFHVRYSPHANFQSQTGEVVLDMGAFGTGILFIDDVPGIGIRYKSFPLSETYITEDAWGRINRLHRKFELTAAQAVTMFDRSRLSEGVTGAAEHAPQTKFWFMHCVYENNAYDARQVLHPVNGKRWASTYIEIATRKVIDEGGYRTFPFAVMRYETGPREVYGRSPAMKVLPTIKTLNEQEKTMLRAGQRVLDPPIMLTDDAALSAFDLRAGALNHGYLDSNGRPLAMPFNSGAKVEFGFEAMEQKRQAINDAFLVTLFRILVDEPQITATEAMLRAQEKGQLLAPTMGRAQAELLGPITERELDILAMNGALPPMPDELVAIGGQYKVEYQSPLNQAQRAGVGVSILNSLQALAPLAQLDSSVMDVVDTHTAARELLEANGFPASAMRDEKEATALSEQRAQAAQMQQLLAAAPVAAGAAKDFAQAQAMAGSAPGGVAPAILPQ